MRSLPYILVGRVTAKGGPPAGRMVGPGPSTFPGESRAWEQADRPRLRA